MLLQNLAGDTPPPKPKEIPQPPRAVSPHLNEKKPDDLAQPRMRPVTKGFVARMLARAPRHRFRLGDLHLLRRQPGARVRTIAKRLALRPPAGAPPVRPRLDLLHNRSLLKNNRFAHNFCIRVIFRLARLPWQDKTSLGRFCFKAEPRFSAFRKSTAFSMPTVRIYCLGPPC
jgi:hypothetical protein